MAPGFGTEESEIDFRLSGESIAAIRARHAAENNIARFYVHYLGAMLHGDLGTSHAFSRPVTELLRERAATTVRTIALGLALAWSLGLSAAIGISLLRLWWADAISSACLGVLMSVPAAVAALLLVMARKPAAYGIAFVVLPNVFRYCRNILQNGWTLPHIVGARARGSGLGRLFCWHVMPHAVPQIIALGGVSISIALGAAIPIEVIADSPGVGQLAWQAAMQRDLPLLVTVTALVTLVTLLANTGSDLMNQAFVRDPSQA
jgi:peptide/nickel transport system permease protein